MNGNFEYIFQVLDEIDADDHNMIKELLFDELMDESSR